MTKPLVQIDNDIREMTDEEYAQYLINIQGTEANYVGIVENPFPVADEPELVADEPVDELVEGEQP
jgi:hypothetical protein